MNKKNWILSLSVAALLALGGTALAKKPPQTCDSTARGNALAGVDAACPCAGTTDSTGATVPWKNHGQYMKCVAHARNGQAKANGLSKNCLKDVVPCAANSSCGKSSAVACISTTGTCLNDPVPGDGTAQGTCDNDSTKACDTDADCSQSTCQITDSADECTALGGTSAGGSCCQ